MVQGHCSGELKGRHLSCWARGLRPPMRLAVERGLFRASALGGGLSCPEVASPDVARQR